MDNLSAHKDARTLTMLEAAEVRVGFLPAYSPELNPIELMWSKVNNLLRCSEARTNDELLLAIGEALSRVTPK